MNKPDISIIIVSFNTIDLLRDCLQSLAKEAGNVNYETIIIDNGSKDGSADMVECEFPEITLIRSEINLGFGAANNLGFAKARGEYVVLLNSDAFLKPMALEKALAYMQADSTIKAIENLKDIPHDVITIEHQDEENIAKLMYSYELLTSIVGNFVQINTYDQPGVEAGKIILKKKLAGK